MALIPKLRTLLAGAAALFQSRRQEEELDDEIRHYLESSISAGIERGMAPARAERDARLALGSVAMLKEEVRSVGWDAHAQMLWI